MSNYKIIQRLDTLEAFASEILREASMLRKELVNSGASASSLKKGLPKTEIDKILNKRKKGRIKKVSRQ